MKRWLPLFMMMVTLGAGLPMAQSSTPDAWRQQAMDSSLSQSERIEAIKRLYPEYLSANGAVPQRTICVWDVLGRSGPIYATAMDQQARLLEMGLNVRIEAYTNEGVLTDDLKAGQCHAGLFTGIRARLFNQFTGTIDAVGAIPSSQHMAMLMQVLSHPRNAPRMEEGQFVVMGFAPMGAAYIFVNDRAISTLARAAGKRVAVMDYDPVQAEMILGLGANPVPISIVQAGSAFNNNNVDVLPAPLVAYSMLELYKGMGDKGGIVNYPFSQLTLQLVGRRDQFPREVAQLIREDFVRRFAEIERQVEQQTGEIPEHLWIAISDAEKAEYQQMMQEARIFLRERDYYHADMLSLQRRVRCRFEPAHAECAQPVE
ncbi:MAG: hypothetical protein IBX52_04635 [Bacterioplanes sp.]|nr:hypothetical protein [Bacterioplanes sp.]